MTKRRVLIADDDADLVNSLTRRCERLGLSVDTAPNAMTALGKIEQDEPDLVILDVGLPQGNGLSVCEMMAGHEELRSLPVIILTGRRDEETIRRCHELCAFYVLKSVDVWSRVEPLLRELLDLPPGATAEATPADDPAEAPSQQRRSSEDVIDSVFAVVGVEADGRFDDADDTAEPREDQPWVLTIEDDEDVAAALRLRLESHGVTVVRSAAGVDGYRKAFFTAPRAILLDYELPNGNGDYVLRRLKETPTLTHVPVIVLTGRREAALERKMRGLGAAEFLTKPFDWTELRSALDRHLAFEPEVIGATSGPPD